MKKIIVLSSILLMLFACGCGETKVDLNEYVNVEFSGRDGNGSAKIVTDTNAFETFISENLKESNGLSTLTALYDLGSCINYSLSKDSDLSNGETVTVSVSWNKDIAKKYGFEFNGNNQDFTVSNLKECEELDLFKDIEINYVGVSPNVNATIINNSSDAFVKSYVNYNLDMAYGLEIGDKITLTANFSESTAEDYGYYVTDKTKEYIVEDTDYYLTEYSEIDSSTLDKLKRQSSDLIEAYFADKYNYKKIIDEITGSYHIFDIDTSLQSVDYNLINSYFFVNKDMSNVSYGNVYNSIFMVYEVKISDSNYLSEPITYYVPVYYKDFIMRNTGDVDVIVTEGYISNAKDTNWDNMYREVVTVNKDNYTFEEISY